MTTLLVLSDTHQNVDEIQKLSQIIDECDYLIHLGDCVYDMKAFYNKYPEKIYIVKGNNDFCSFTDSEIVLEIEGNKILLCHGHKYGVKSSLKYLCEYAKEKGCNIVLFGHTHIAQVKEIDGITLINPGTLRRLSAQKSYCYLVIHGGKIVPTIKYVY